jgi:hypothetical protein
MYLSILDDTMTHHEVHDHWSMDGGPVLVESFLRHSLLARNECSDANESFG